MPRKNVAPLWDQTYILLETQRDTFTRDLDDITETTIIHNVQYEEGDASAPTMKVS